MRTNESILQERMEAFNRRPGARVGDFLRLQVPDPRCPNYTRFTHDWGDSIQTGGQSGGSFYLGSNYLSYSGGLDPGVDKTDLIPTNEVKAGACWFSDGGISGAGRGVTNWQHFRVFDLKPGAKSDGIGELRTHWYLAVVDTESEWAKRHGYTCRYGLSRSAVNQTAFHTEAELRAWLVKERFALSADISQSQCLDWPGLHWCPICARNNAFCNQCGCDPDNLPTKVP